MRLTLGASSLAVRATTLVMSAVVFALEPAWAEPPRPIDPPSPEYPKWAIGSGVDTEVELRVLVGRDGRVRNVEVVPYNVKLDILTRGMRASFDSAAVRAVRTWTFEPGTRGGRAVTAWRVLQVRFDDPADGPASPDSLAPPDTTAGADIDLFPQPLKREWPEWPAAVPYLCRGRVTVRIFPNRQGRVMGARVAKFPLDCQDPGIRAAVSDAVVRAALRWRYRAGEDEEAPFLVEFEIPPPRRDVAVIVGCVRDSLTGKPRPGAEIFGRDRSRPFGSADDSGWFVLRGAATQVPMVRARFGLCRWGGYRTVRSWKKRGDELVLYTGRGNCVDKTQ